MIVLIDPDSVKIQPEHKAVLQGLLMRNPDMTLSDLLEIALEPFCEENRGAAGETKVIVEIIAQPEKELV